ncbi:MAG TPA: DUF4382 domain-containing protein [Terracidiphilus sp.]|nr:DUF4382 domain-containing protein [Terracidiphilus sp.]
MMRKTLPFVFVPSILALLAGCGSNSHHTVICSCPVTYAPVSITMTDDPPAGVSVLFFQVSLTNATLTPASSTGNPVSLLSNNTPIQVDVTQLQALSAFLGTMNAQPGTYSSLSLTFASPQLVIYNQSDTSLGSSCAVGSICQLTPSFDDNSATQTFTSSPFPLTLSNNSPISLLIDFHLNNVIQSDLSVNLGVSNGVTVSELPSSPAVPQFGFVTGTVLGTTPSLSQFTMQTQWGGTFTVGTTSSTTFNNFPSSVCAAAGFACLAQGQVVEAQISNFTGFSNVTASQVAYVQTANTQTVQGTIINVIPSATDIAGAPPMGFEMILHANPTNVTGFPLGGQALVCLPANTTYSVDAGGFTMPSGASFTSGNNLTVGQTVTVTAQPGSLNNPCLSGPPGSGVISFVASTIELEPSQMTGSITAIDSGTTSFTLGTGSLFFAPWPLPPGISSYNVLATSQTTFMGFDPDSFSGLATQDIVSVNGWVFQTETSASPTIAAQSVVMRPSGTF